MKITKFRLISDRPEETKFLVKKIKKTISYMETESVTDDYGNILSSRDKDSIKITPASKTIEGIVAYSLPSKTKAFIEVLETEDGLDENFERIDDEFKKSESNGKSSERPEKNITKTMEDQVEERVKRSKTKWVD